MISKSLRNIALRKTTIVHPALLSVQSRKMGGGPKKPNMPASETNFDIVFVGT